MNEPIISPWLFYWIGMVNSLIGIIFVSGIVLIMSFGIAWLNADDFKTPAKVFRRFTLLGILLVILSAFIPTKGTLVQMIVASKVTPANMQLVEDKTTDLADKAFTRIEQTAINIIKEVKK